MRIDLPRFTSFAAASTFCGEMLFSAPSWSFGPHLDL